MGGATGGSGQQRAAMLAAIEEGADRLAKNVAGLDDARLRAASGLPGWTRGHVATHVARNADSLWNLLEWARTGRKVPQYASFEAREEGLRAGAGRGADELADDLRTSAERFAAQARALPDEAWDFRVRGLIGPEMPAWFVLHRRWRETEVHHVDLAAGYGPADWPVDYVRAELEHTLRGLTELAPDGRGGLAGLRLRATDTGQSADLGDGPEVTGSAAALLAWITGRSDGPGLTTRPDGALPTPPNWPVDPSIP
ncbi:maleylpyruvate isomerase family mycothiol-dependent enzyme [Actinomadura harenae]|uniref:Maleylpyruvate isomerase family mycothiol-dependent enzyme n=1 Tax=Actinomadura harenae TaxID=2483351 RepID=A0A3M2M0I6_9ACTN|nr:maleylpyruvate isomerase family mycothiol-dependent enzyme [Actinomadura harenae]RMI42942.1 maleylpyruvate isomerase family mycothiol-dependent enzyme [Actinomadura harenae]